MVTAGLVRQDRALDLELGRRLLSGGIDELHDIDPATSAVDLAGIDLLVAVGADTAIETARLAHTIDTPILFLDGRHLPTVHGTTFAAARTRPVPVLAYRFEPGPAELAMAEVQIEPAAPGTALSLARDRCHPCWQHVIGAAVRVRNGTPVGGRPLVRSDRPVIDVDLPVPAEVLALAQATSSPTVLVRCSGPIQLHVDRTRSLAALANTIVGISLDPRPLRVLDLHPAGEPGRRSVKGPAG
jgi:hypothetical protein